MAKPRNCRLGAIFLIVSTVGLALVFWGMPALAQPELAVTVNKPQRVQPGNTLFPFNVDHNNPRIIEVNPSGNIVWQYNLPDELKSFTNPGLDAELLDNGNILIMLPRYGVQEIDRNGNVVWLHRDLKVSHDADRLDNGNTIMVWGVDSFDDAQVKEVNPAGEIVWQWFAKDHFGGEPFRDVSCQGFTHTNSVTRLQNGNSLISMRNFNFLVMVDPAGNLVQTIGRGVVYSPHDPQYLAGDKIVLASQRPLECYLPNEPGQAVTVYPASEIDPATGDILWSFGTDNRWTGQLTRDVNRLANGNTLVVGTNKIVEVTRGGEIVWQLESNAELNEGETAASIGFFKAQRVDDWL